MGAGRAWAEQTHDGLDGVHGQPPLAGLFVPVLIFAGRVLQDSGRGTSSADVSGQGHRKGGIGLTRMEMQTLPSG